MTSIDISLTAFLSELVLAIKSSNTQWMENNLDRIYDNRKKKATLELDIEETIILRKAAIKNELNRKNIEYEAKLKQLQMKVDQETKNYEYFLQDLDKMKAKIMNTFKHVPPTIALLIHRHASELLNQMWNENDITKRTTLEVKLFNLLNTVNDDVRALEASEEGTYYRPEKTITLIMDQEN